MNKEIKLTFTEEEFKKIEEVKNRVDPTGLITTEGFIKEMISNLTNDYMAFVNHDYANLSEQMQSLKEAFNSINPNGDGNVDFTELFNQTLKYDDKKETKAKDKKDEEEEKKKVTSKEAPKIKKS
ncbi:hypothetical protein [Ureaplasma canigenitalium]|uniref:hypothetical protein n=1 Tax=Ureaplasma canigenitalium TaxID=42092 RepID=UPI0004E20DA5|nr:hypothetical protein [Ureaplasma canigenitalium]